MPFPTSPTIRRQRLGKELRDLRKALGLTGDQVIERLGWASASKLSRLENAQSRPDLADIMDLLDVYEVTGGKREELIAIARDAASSRGWYRAFADVGARQRAYAELESSAAEIFQYEQLHVPGLLQTPEYARYRVESALPVHGKLDVEAEARARPARQGILTRASPPRYEAILEEAVLRRNAAPAEVMRAQLHRLQEFADRPNVTLRVLPTDVKIGDYYLPMTSFSCYRFPDPADPEVITLETLTSDVQLRDEEDTAPYRKVFGWLRDAALSPDDTTKLIVALVKQP